MLPSFVKTPKSLVCANATTIANARIVKSAQTRANAIAFGMMSDSSAPSGAFYITDELAWQITRGVRACDGEMGSNRNGYPHRPALSRPLIRIERLIRSRNHHLGLVPGVILLPAGGILDRNFSPVPLHLQRTEPVQNQLQLRQIAFRQNQQKLIPTHANRQIPAPNHAIERRRKFLQHQISRRMPKRIIDVLEFVEVHQHDRQRMPLPRRTRHLSDKPLLRKPPVIQPRQRINHRQIAQQHRVVLLLRKLAPQALNQYLLVDRVNVEEHHQGYQPKNRLREPDPEKCRRSL